MVMALKKKLLSGDVVMRICFESYTFCVNRGSRTKFIFKKKEELKNVKIL